MATAFQSGAFQIGAFQIDGSVPVTVADISAPGTIYVNRPFQVRMTLTNAEATQIVLYYLLPKITGPAVAGNPVVLGGPRLALSSTYARIDPGATAEAEWDAVVWEPGTYTVDAFVALRDGTPVPTNPAILTAYWSA